MATGTVKWFNITKGFGFIIPDGGGNDVFLPLQHVEAAKLPRLETGMKLNFSVVTSRGRTVADNLSLVETGEAVRVQSPDDDNVEDFETEWGLRRS